MRRKTENHGGVLWLYPQGNTMNNETGQCCGDYEIIRLSTQTTSLRISFLPDIINSVKKLVYYCVRKFKYSVQNYSGRNCCAMSNDSVKWCVVALLKYLTTCRYCKIHFSTDLCCWQLRKSKISHDSLTRRCQHYHMILNKLFTILFSGYSICLQ